MKTAQDFISTASWSSKQGIEFQEKETSTRKRLFEFISYFEKQLLDEIRSEAEIVFFGSDYEKGESLFSGEKININFEKEFLIFYIITNQSPSISLLDWSKLITEKAREKFSINIRLFFLTTKALRKKAGTLWLYNLVHGSKVLYCKSENSLLQLKEKCPQGRLKPQEATLLLFEAGKKLWKAQDYISQEINMEYVQEAHNETRLSLGDSITIIYNYYSSSIRARHATLFEIPLPHPWGANIAPLHQEGFARKKLLQNDFTPWKILREENFFLISLWKNVFLHIESIRLKKPFLSLKQYTEQKTRIFETEPWWISVLKNIFRVIFTLRCTRPIYETHQANLLRILTAILSSSPNNKLTESHFLFPAPQTREDFLEKYKKLLNENG